MGIGGQLLNMFLCIGMGFGFGAQILLSQQVGAKDHDLQPTIGTLFTTELIASIVFGILGIVFCNPLLSIMNTPDAVWADARSYTIICCCGMVFIYGYNAVCAILRGMGESKLPMIFIAIASVVNLVLDLLFVEMCIRDRCRCILWRPCLLQRHRHPHRRQKLRRAGNRLSGRLHHRSGYRRHH